MQISWDNVTKWSISRKAGQRAMSGRGLGGLGSKWRAIGGCGEPQAAVGRVRQPAEASELPAHGFVCMATSLA